MAIKVTTEELNRVRKRYGVTKKDEEEKDEEDELTRIRRKYASERLGEEATPTSEPEKEGLFGKVRKKLGGVFKTKEKREEEDLGITPTPVPAPEKPKEEKQELYEFESAGKETLEAATLEKEEPKIQIIDDDIVFDSAELEQAFIRNIEADKRDHTIYNNAIGEISGSLIAGTGDVITGTGQAARWLGYNGMADTLIKKGGEFQIYQPELDPELIEFNWKDLYNPRYWTQQAARGVPFTLATIPMAYASLYATGSALTALGISTTSSIILGTIFSQTVPSAYEAAVEAGGVYDEALARNMTKEEADKAADKTFGGSFKVLMVSNTLQMIPFVKQAMSKTELDDVIIKRIINSNQGILKKTGKKVVIYGLEQQAESLEEVLQSREASLALGDEFSFTSSETQRTYVQAGIQSLLFTSGGIIIDASTGRNVTKEFTEIGIQDAKNTIREIEDSAILRADASIKVAEKGRSAALNDIAKNNPEIIKEATIEILSEKIVQEESQQEVEASERNKVTEKVDEVPTKTGVGETSIEKALKARKEKLMGRTNETGESVSKWIEREIGNGSKIEEAKVKDTRALDQLEQEYKRLRRQGYGLGNMELPENKRVAELRKILKNPEQFGNVKTEYRLVDPDGIITDISKTEYEYAQALKNVAQQPLKTGVGEGKREIPKGALARADAFEETKQFSQKLIDKAKNLSNFKEGERVYDVYTGDVTTIGKRKRGGLVELIDQEGNVRTTNELANTRYVKPEEVRGKDYYATYKGTNYSFKATSVENAKSQARQLLGGIGDLWTDYNTETKKWDNKNVLEQQKPAKVEPTKPLEPSRKPESTQDVTLTIQESERNLQDTYSQNKDASEEALYQVFTELDVAEAGQRIRLESGEIKGISSTFPSWIPEDLRSKDLINKVLENLVEVDKLKYPEANRTRQRELYDAILDEVDNRAGIDTSDVRGAIMEMYEQQSKAKKEKKASKTKKVVRQRIKGSEKGEIKKVEKELSDEVGKRIGEIQPPGGLQVKPLGKPLIKDDVSGMEFSDPEVEERYKNSRGIETSGSYQKKLKEFIGNFYRRLTRTYPDIPNKPKFAEFKNILSKQREVRSVVQDRTARILQGVTSDIGENKLDLLTRKIILDDLTQEAKSKRALPLGYSEYDADGNLIIKEELLSADKEKIDRLVFENQDVAEALERRNKIWKAIRNDLVKYNILKKSQVKKDYFRHQILEYVNAKSRLTKGVGTKLKQRKPSYAKQRRGSTYDINTDYLEAEFQVMSQALHDIEIAKLLNEIEDLPINIKPKLVKEAKRKGIEDWHDLIPKGYETWQPKDGRIFYQAYTVPESILNQFIDDVGQDVLKIDAELVHKALVVGKKRKELVLPEGVVKTLDNLWIAKQPNWIRDSAKALTTTWKKWVLFNPRRVVKYNYQNFLGDSDAVIAGNPAVFKKLPEATKELYAVFAEDAPMTDTMRDFFERGGFSSMLTVQEIPDIKNIRIFERFYEKANKKKTTLQKLNVFRGYWNSVVKFTQFRESMLRYAAYLDYIERFESGKKLNFGASNRKDVMALKSPKDKAAKVAIELLGDYANISALGKDMRETLIPFYSWMEVNMTRYPKILRNAWQDGYKEGSTTTTRALGVTAVKGSWSLVKVLLRMMSLTGAVLLYNQLFHGDAEEDLSDYDRGRMHINFGYDKDGNVVILRGQGAFADLLEWFGLGEAPLLFREYFEGKSSMTDIVGKIPFVTGQVGLKPMVQKLIGSINPLYKTPVEFTTGNSIPYQGTKSYPIEDKWRNLFRNISLENEYDYIFDKPSRGYLKSWEFAVITKTDPLENAYRYIQAQKYAYLETKGKGGSGDYYTSRSIVYRAYKKALRYGDKEAEDKAYEEMRKLGVKKSDLEKSLEWSKPLAGLNEDERKEFVNEYLSTSDRVRYEKAKKYYNKTFLGL